MSFEENIKRGVLYSFIPKRLEIKGRPELENFPFNVLFASFTVKSGAQVMGNALYEPDLSSLKKEGSVYSMKYHNAYGGDCWLLIAYDETERSYTGEKFINGKSVGMAVGMVWNMFFLHFTALGLTEGERCLFW